MKLDISILKGVSDVDLTQHHWHTLYQLVQKNPIPGIQFEETFNEWIIKEQCEEFQFCFTRNRISLARRTVANDLGVIGFASINPKDPRVYITEGVSDFLTVKLMRPNLNVLGFTTPGGSKVARSIVMSLFDKVCYISDNDYQSSTNTGFAIASRIKSVFDAKGKSCKIILPEVPFKDITDQFINTLKYHNHG